jgi:hypothetical protein
MAIYDLCDKMNDEENITYNMRKIYYEKYEEMEHINNKDYKINPWDLYNLLFLGETLNFDLLADGKKCSIILNLNNNVRNRTEFNRKIKFVNGEQINIDE